MAAVRSVSSIGGGSNRMVAQFEGGFSASSPHFGIANSKLKKLIIVALVIVGAVFLAYLMGSLGASKASENQNMNLLNSEPNDSSGGGSSGVPTDSSNSSGNASQSSGSQATNSSSNSVKINGQSVDVPQNGSYNETVNTSSGQVNVSGENQSSSSTSGSTASNNSSTSVNIQSDN